MSAAQESRAVNEMTASELVDLAWEYAGDGAFFSAADCLRAAADRLQAKGEQLHRRLGIRTDRP